MIQVQPQRVHIKEYLELGLQFEIMDFAFPVFNEAEINRAYEGISIPSMHGAFIDINFASNDPDIQKVSQHRVILSIQKGIALGVKNVVLHTCFYPVLNDAVLYELWCDKAAEFLNRIANEYDINIFIENTLDLSPDILYQLMQKVDNTRINICFDVGHAFLSKTCISDWLAALNPYIKYMHINDNFGIYDEHLAVGDGNIDWILLKNLIKKYNLDPIITLEVTGISKIKKSLQYWERI